MTERHITDDGVGLAYTDEGPRGAPVLILSNSLGTTRALWERPAAALATTFRVIRYDTRGHGESDVPDGDYSIARLGHDVVSLMDGLSIARAHVAGVSVGGLTALWLGIHAPERVNRLVLLNTGAVIATPEVWRERIQTARTEGLRALADRAIGRWFTEGFRAREPETFERFRAALAATPPEGYAGCCASMRDADLRPDAGRVRAQTLVIVGRHDQATPPALGEWLRDHIPGAQLLEVDAAHLSTVEAPEDVARGMAGFLET
ncbi:MAG: 3-oxoadipate enol-lactonase [Acidobacteriota bacterium]